MIRTFRSAARSALLVAVAPVALAATAEAQNQINFDPFGVGVDKSVAMWGVDAAWPSDFNVRLSTNNLGGPANIDFTRINFYIDEPVVNGQLGQASRDRIDRQLALADLSGSNQPIGLVPNGENGIPGYYFDNGDANVSSYIAVIEATRQYVNSKGRSLAFVEPYNEPDFIYVGTRDRLGDIIDGLKNTGNYNNTLLMAASTLRANNNAYFWYDGARDTATAGSSHLLDGAGEGRVLEAWSNFMGNYVEPGVQAWNPEIHSMAEILVGSDVGMDGGSVWGAAMRPRGLAIQASEGIRLGYAVDFDNESAGAVYRGPDGEITAFAGGVERAGSESSYTFTSTNGAVWFNGIGPIESYTMLTNQDTGGYVDIATSEADAVAPLDGYRWKIVNRQTGEVLDVNNLSTDDGGNIQTFAGNGQDNQRWDIRQVFHAYDANTPLDGYFEIINTNSGKTAEVANYSLEDGANVQQFGDGQNLDNGGFLTRFWYVEKTGDGYFHIRNANSAGYLSGSGGMNGNAVQRTDGSSFLSQWEFVLANPDAADGIRTGYGFDGNTQSVTGANNAIAFGNPSYVNGIQGQAIDLDGADDYLQLSNSIADETDMTIATWVKWDGGNAWQRIFDFGDGTESYMFLTPSSADGMLRFAITTDGYLNEQAMQAEGLEVGEWFHVAVTLGGNTGILYVNGQPVTAGQFTIDPSDLAATMNYIGRSQFASDPLFNGQFDNFQIYDFALSPDQIATLVPEPASAAAIASFAGLLLRRRPAKR